MIIWILDKSVYVWFVVGVMLLVGIDFIDFVICDIGEFEWLYLVWLVIDYDS